MSSCFLGVPELPEPFPGSPPSAGTRLKARWQHQNRGLGDCGCVTPQCPAPCWGALPSQRGLWGCSPCLSACFAFQLCGKELVRLQGGCRGKNCKVLQPAGHRRVFGVRNTPGCVSAPAAVALSWAEPGGAQRGGS